MTSPHTQQKRRMMRRKEKMMVRVNKTKMLMLAMVRRR
jgi:hypothetical protein